MGQFKNILQEQYAKFVAAYRLSDTSQEQIDELRPNAVLALVANAVITLFVVRLFYPTPLKAFVLVWSTFSFASTFVGLFLLSRGSAAEGQSKSAPRVARLTVAMAALRGLIWAVGLIVLMPNSASQTAMLMNWVMFGLLCGGVFAYRALPLAALSFSAFIFVGGCLSVGVAADTAKLFDVIALSFTFFIFNGFTAFGANSLRLRIETEHNLRNEREVVGLLLRDFEEGSKDWLWQADQSGKLLRGFRGFRAALLSNAVELQQLSMPDAFEVMSVSSGQREAIVKLRAAFRAGLAFSNLALSVGEGTHTRHFELTAKPVKTRDGAPAWQGVATDTTIAREAEIRVQKMAMYDTLTGLPNRSTFRDQALAACAAPGRDSLWMLYGDLDGFKQINDMLGHAAGDRVLIDVARRFERSMLAGENVARIGGDEFAFLVQRSVGEVEALWRDLISISADPFIIHGQPRHIGLSLGIVEISDRSINVDELLRRADVTLYHAKQSGRGTACHFNVEMDQAAKKRRMMEQALREAIDRRDFVLHYQPIYSCRDKQLRGYEALIRWQHGAMGNVPPMDFIPIAEECGLIAEIGAWTLEQACLDAMQFPNGVTVAVNLSSVQLRSKRLLVDVTRALAHSGLDASRLELELTETALVENTEFASAMISDLKALGVQIALDDFGTGYSSLAYLHKFKFDRIKIDRSFVQAYALQAESRAVVDAVLMMARSLDIATTAEGIETLDQYETMALKGCDDAQGYLLGRPAAVVVHRAQIAATA